MQISKLLKSIFWFVFFLVLLSVLVIAPDLKLKGQYFLDNDLRARLSGSLDYLIIGDSCPLAGVIPEVLNSELNCHAYNLSGPWMTVNGMDCLIRKEVSRNPVDTVVLMLSWQFVSSEDTHYGEGDSVTVRRLDSFLEGLRYMLRNVSVDDWLNIYSTCLIEGESWWLRICRGGQRTQLDESYLGFHPKDGNDVSLTIEEIERSLDSSKINFSLSEEHYDTISNLVSFLQEKGIRVILVNHPLSDANTWSYQDMDSYLQWCKSFSAIHECLFFDFNLLKGKSDWFSDEVSWSDQVHMSEEGACQFSLVLAQILKQVDCGDDVNSLFFESYAESKINSPYYAIWEGIR